MSHGGMRTKVFTQNATITSNSRQDIVPAESGYSFQLFQLMATNELATTHSFTVFNGDQSVTPPVIIGGSGTFIWDWPGLAYLSTAIGSGINAAVSPTGSFRVTAYYRKIDERTPISSEQARSASFIPKTIRMPNHFGSQ